MGVQCVEWQCEYTMTAFPEACFLVSDLVIEKVSIAHSRSDSFHPWEVLERSCLRVLS